ncbi:MAG: DUF167 domain-containing protein [Candidatus Yanofskybacteria bacterium]|nr:DUF167 domain-containing protein [Candidatus Yanofskybacteria bacterium]
MKIIVRVKPGARADSVEKIAENEYRVSTKEPPIQGRANRGVIAILASHFSVAPSRVSIVSGFTSRKKSIEIREN